MYIFLDESGQFANSDESKYFIVGSFSTKNQKLTAKSYNSWIKTKFPRKTSTQAEVKWSQSCIDQNLRIKTLKHISEMDIEIKYVYFLAKNIPVKYRKKNRIESGQLYIDIIVTLLKKYLHEKLLEIYIYCDERSLKGIKKSEFELNVLEKVSKYCKNKVRIKIQMINSLSNPNIQIADWISGGISSFLEQKTHGKEYIDTLSASPSFLGEEIFNLKHGIQDVDNKSNNN